MKGDHLPIIQALKGKMKLKSKHTAFDTFEPPRSLQVNHHEVPGLPGRKVGESISVRLHGHIHSQNSEGHAIVHVSSVKPDSSQSDNSEYPEQKPTMKKPLLVQTQQSQA